MQQKDNITLLLRVRQAYHAPAAVADQAAAGRVHTAESWAAAFAAGVVRIDRGQAGVRRRGCCQADRRPDCGRAGPASAAEVARGQWLAGTVYEYQQLVYKR